jgi:FhuF 2Fe-2S C-terminal domain
MQLGLVARLIAPALAAVALGRPGLLGSYPSGVWWQDELGGPMPLSVPVPGDSSRRHLTDRLIDEAVDPITTAVAGLGDVSPRVLWGNVASAGNGAAAQIAAARPGLAPAAWAAAAALARHPRLSTEPAPPGPAFRRSSCCLIYQLSPGRPRAVCGDCILVR